MTGCLRALIGLAVFSGVAYLAWVLYGQGKTGYCVALAIGDLIFAMSFRVTGRGSSWKTDPATDRQIEFIRDLGGTPKRGMTKGEASDYIDLLKGQ